MAKKKTYTGKDIQVLEGLDPVRKRPGMYIGGTGRAGLHHLLWEVVDNAVDEATNGYATSIDVVLHKDGQSCTVTDNGRGIPVDIHPTKKKPTLEVILTTLHSGGKFDGSSYITSGGLHGVGSSVVNALSETLIATVKRDGHTFTQTYEQGKPTTKLKKKGTARGTGTSIYFKPDTEIFDSVDFDAGIIGEWLEEKTYLNGTLKISFNDQKNGQKYQYSHEGGITEFLDHLITSEQIGKTHPDVFEIKQPELKDGVRVELVLQWTDHHKDRIKSYVNGIQTQDGGTHETGLKDGVVKAVRNYMETYGLSDKKLDITADDIREGMFAIINLFMVDPQFQGQTKDKLNNPEIRSSISGAFRVELEQYLNEHPSTGDAIAARVIQAAKARLASRAAIKEVRRKTKVSHRLNLPGKLADCSSTDPSVSELFIVEGDSAGGSAKQGRDRKTQAILPLRGKVLNAEQATVAKVKANKELADIVQALGCGMGDNIDLSGLRYDKIILLMDADSDGHHIATLLLTFMYRYLRPLIENGKVFIAQPPLFRIDTKKETHWALDEKTKEKIVKDLQKGKRNVNVEVQRFKGLGEMMPATLKETTLDKDKRMLLRVTIPDGGKSVTEKTMSDLMGKDANRRYVFIMKNAKEVEDLDV